MIIRPEALIHEHDEDSALPLSHQVRQTVNTNSDKYIPAFSYGFLTPLYDLIMRLTMREQTFKRHLVAQA
ncbi:MAG: hypothetical protein V1850_07465, partial [Candidatus Bathyarchaeota archaeon]